MRGEESVSLRDPTPSGKQFYAGKILFSIKKITMDECG